jgi:hypothetical protein
MMGGNMMGGTNMRTGKQNRPQSMGGTRIDGTRIDGWHHAQTDYRKPAKRQLAAVDGWQQHGTMIAAVYRLPPRKLGGR